jgi:hypothetical protein
LEDRLNIILAFLIFVPILFSAPTISFTNHVFPIVAQNGNYNYVAPGQVVTKYELAKNDAYLTHNPGAGSHFLELAVGDIVTAGKQYTVTRIERYAVNGSNYINQTTGQVYDVAGLFSLYYLDPKLLILQTCITVNGNTQGGRLFVVGE